MIWILYNRISTTRLIRARDYSRNYKRKERDEHVSRNEKIGKKALAPEKRSGEPKIRGRDYNAARPNGPKIRQVAHEVHAPKGIKVENDGIRKSIQPKYAQ